MVPRASAQETADAGETTPDALGRTAFAAAPFGSWGGSVAGEFDGVLGWMGAVGWEAALGQQ